MRDNVKIIEPSHEILTHISEGGIAELKAIERAARTCYKSESAITEDGESAKRLIKKLVDNGHDAMLEHVSLTVRFITDRGVSHEMVRHRLASYAQESTRYCNYSKGRFGGEVTVIKPAAIEDDTPAYRIWKSACERAEIAYFDLLADGCSPQQARAVLPNSLKTEIVVTANIREWRHILFLRAAHNAHQDMVRLVIPLLADLKKRIPIVFDDIGRNDG